MKIIVESMYEKSEEAGVFRNKPVLSPEIERKNIR
jgi:hypothetical protein